MRATMAASKSIFTFYWVRQRLTLVVQNRETNKRWRGGLVKENNIRLKEGRDLGDSIVGGR